MEVAGQSYRNLLETVLEEIKYESNEDAESKQRKLHTALTNAANETTK